MVNQAQNSDLCVNGCEKEITVDIDITNSSKNDSGTFKTSENNSEKDDAHKDVVKVMNENGNKTEKCLLGGPQSDATMSFMEEESIRERIRSTLLKQCSAILKQGDQRYNKESLHKTFQDEDLLERIFRLFDVERKDHLVQEDWLEFLKEGFTDDKQLDFLEQVESVAYVLCGDGVICLDSFQKILKNRVVTNKLLRVVDTDGDGYATADEVMEFISAISCSRPRKGMDKTSVDRLEQLFRQTVGDQKEITREQFQKIVVSKNPFFTERVFQIFDEDNSGTISHHEFIKSVHQFGMQTPEDKIRFLFKVYDLDGDGLIQHRELQHVMRACMEENGMQFSDDQLLDLTTAMFEDADIEQRGAITYAGLRNQLNKHGGLLENLSISIDRWLVPPNPKQEQISFCRKLAKLKQYHLSLSYFKNNYVLLIYLGLFFLVNFGLFVARIVEYRESNVFVIFARACGQCLNFNCSWVLVLMLRHCITFLRVRGAGCLLPLDHHVYLHKLTGILIIIYSIIHTVMHFCNFSIVVVNDPVLNANNFTLWEWVGTSRPELFGLVPGVANPTGLALCVVLIVMSVCSRSAVRRDGSFEVFYWTHLLYVPFWVLMIFHAPNFWKWFIAPGTIYVIERIMRLIWMRSKRGKTYISSGILLPSRVTHLVVKRPPLFEFHAGDYVFVNIPAIATYEWHPFTISSAPDLEEYLWLHIRGVGEWTNRLYSYFESEQERLHGLDSIPHERIARSSSCHSNKSRKRESNASKKRSVDFSPAGYSNEGFVMDEGRPTNGLQVSNMRLSQPIMTPLQLLEKSRSLPDVYNNTKKKQRLIALQDYTRCESERSFDECELRRARLRSAGLSDRAHRSPQLRAAAHSFRYMRNKPTIIAFKPPSPEERRKSNDSILTLARRRLSKSLSPDRDIEASDDPVINVISPSESSNSESILSNYPVGKPLKTNRLLQRNSSVMSTRDYVKFLGRETQILPTLDTNMKIYLDGPYGAASSHIFRAQHAVLIAAGIGVTPFASILQSIMYRYWSSRNVCPKCDHTWASDLTKIMSLKKVDFFWINREQRSFEWFVSLLSQLEIEQAELGARFLEMHMYITSALQRSDMKAVGLQLALDLLHEKEKRDLITGLKTRTNAGRPNWDKVFQRIQEQRQGKVTVFYCGPPQLARILRVKCNQFGFIFRKEVF